MRISLGELRRLIRETIEESMALTETVNVFGPPGSPLWGSGMENISPLSKVKDVVPVSYEKIDRNTGVSLGWRKGVKQVTREEPLWDWKPFSTRRITDLELPVALEAGVPVFADRSELTDEEFKLIMSLRAKLFSAKHPKSPANQVLSPNQTETNQTFEPRLVKTADGKWLMYGQWVHRDPSEHQPRFTPPARGEIPALVSRAAQERRAAKNAPSGPSSVSVVRRRRDEETGAVTSITPVRGNRR
jgi:hypothetical protein